MNKRELFNIIKRKEEALSKTDNLIVRQILKDQIHELYKEYKALDDYSWPF